MSALYWFLVWLTTYANHVEWLVAVPHGPTATVVYGGNFIDAWHLAQSLGNGAWVSQVGIP